MLLSGYRDLKEYQQRVGSPLLNIAEIEWLAPLNHQDTKQLICDRAAQENISLTEQTISAIMEWSGCHPYLTQQLLNIIFDHHQQESWTNLINQLLQYHDKDFSSWWNAEHLSGCFSEDERTVYFALLQQRTATPQDNSCQGATVSSHQAFAGTAPNLVRRGIPAVIAMQYNIWNSTAKLFADEFYRKLAIGLLISCTILNKTKKTGFINEKLRF
ncbi:MAG: CHAT domain-containing protein [Nostocaceae cyanobacterium]|nr:CHAT domain-containing protein [Nostocaceae cyanobacterium]